MKRQIVLVTLLGVVSVINSGCQSQKVESTSKPAADNSKQQSNSTNEPSQQPAARVPPIGSNVGNSPDPSQLQDPAKSDPAKSDPAKSESAKSESAKSESVIKNDEAVEAKPKIISLAEEQNRTASDSPYVEDSVLPEISADWKRLDPDYEIWLDSKNRQVVVGGSICLRYGQLEMFACPRNTKEHESVVAVNCRAELIHTALLVLGANPGHTVQYEPEYKAAVGPEIEITVRWLDDAGKPIDRRSQEMVRAFRTKEELKYPWVFGGSSFFEDPETHKQIYRGNGGQLVCVSNFSDAMIDIPVESSSAATDLLYEANTEKIPFAGTRVLLIFKPSPDAPK